MTTFQNLLSEMREEMDLQFDRLDHLTMSNFDWLDKLLVEIQPLYTIDDNGLQETTIATCNQTQSMILPLSDSCMTLDSQADALHDIFTTESESMLNDDKVEYSYGINKETNQHNNVENQDNNSIFVKTAPKSKRTSLIAGGLLDENSHKNLFSAKCNLNSNVDLDDNDDFENDNGSADMNSSDLDSFSQKRYYISDFASELTSSAQLFRKKWKESLSGQKKEK